MENTNSNQSAAYLLSSMPFPVQHYFYQQIEKLVPQFNTRTKINVVKFDGYVYNVREYTDRPPTVYAYRQTKKGFLWGILRYIGYVLNNKKIIALTENKVPYINTSYIDKELMVTTLFYDYRYVEYGYATPFYLKFAYWSATDTLYIEV